MPWRNPNVPRRNPDVPSHEFLKCRVPEVPWRNPDVLREFLGTRKFLECFFSRISCSSRIPGYLRLCRMYFFSKINDLPEFRGKLRSKTTQTTLRCQISHDQHKQSTWTFSNNFLSTKRPGSQIPKLVTQRATLHSVSMVPSCTRME